MNKRLLFYIASAICLCFSCQSNTSNTRNKNNIDQQFLLSNIVDTSGKIVVLDFSKSELTIVDFWNNSCPPCISEMKQFPSRITGKESKISIFSISVNQFWLWKPTLQNHSGPFSFLNYDLPNWKQYNLKTNDNPKFKNNFSADRLKELDSLYGVKGNPAYFVVNKTGKILARPESAIKFLDELK